MWTSERIKIIDIERNASVGIVFREHKCFFCFNTIFRTVRLEVEVTFYVDVGSIATTNHKLATVDIYTATIVVRQPVAGATCDGSIPVDDCIVIYVTHIAEGYRRSSTRSIVVDQCYGTTANRVGITLNIGIVNLVEVVRENNISDEVCFTVLVAVDYWCVGI